MPTGRSSYDLPDRPVDNGGKSKNRPSVPMDVYIEWLCYERANALANREYLWS